MFDITFLSETFSLKVCTELVSTILPAAIFFL